MNDEGGPPGEGQKPPEGPDYKVYRSRPGLLSRFRRPELGSLGRKGEGAPKGPKPPRRLKLPGRGEPGVPGEPSTARRVLKWVAIGTFVWILISFAAFSISSQLQKMKLDDGVGDVLDGNPFLAVSPQTILVMGTDVRPSGLSAQADETPEKCVEAAGEGKTPPSGCSYRADTLMLLRVGGGAFRKLSIPRDALANIPDSGPQKINGAYAIGGAELQVETVEQFLGIDVDQVALIDFNGFRDLINSLGGIEVDLNKKVCSAISGGEANGGFTLELDEGENTLNADEALSLSRTRSNLPTDSKGEPCPPLSDVDRVQFQQVVLQGIKGRLTSPTRLPYNIIKGPIIGWNAPKSMVSSMGGLLMPELLFGVAIGGDEGTALLEPESLADPLIIPQEECDQKVKKFLGDDPPRDPECSPA
jgi:LCP family protein required for cell wall assembly